MTQEDSVRRLAEIRERADKATPGPWEYEHEDYVSSVYLGSANAGSYPVQRAPIHRDTDITDRQADEARSTVEFIAHSREDVPYLLSVIDSLTAERDHDRHRKEVAEFEREEVRAALTRAIEAADSRAEAAEAREARLREMMEKVAIQAERHMKGPDGYYSIAAKARAALATPPSEGQS